MFPYYALWPLMSVMNSESINIINLKNSRTSTCRTYSAAPEKCTSVGHFDATVQTAAYTGFDCFIVADYFRKSNIQL